MKRFGRFLLYALLFLGALMLFTPKANLYYLLERQLQPLGIVIGGESARDTGFGLEIDGATLYARQVESASAARIGVGLFGLYNRIALDAVELSGALASFWPAKIARAEAVYAFWDPLHVTLDAEGDFGSLSAVISLKERTFAARIEPSQLMSRRYGATLKRFKRDDTGGYRYESGF